MKKWRCTACSYIYDPAVGDPDNGVPAGTAFDAIPDDWVCPVCGVGKDMFEEVADEGGPSTGSGSPQRNAGPPRA